MIRSLAILGLAGASACIHPLTAESSLVALPRSVGSSSDYTSSSRSTGLVPLPAEFSRAIETRLEELDRRGGVCSAYGEVLERSYRSGRIKLRPYMWRVRGRLVSGQANPNGEMILAREIDSLNVGLRTVDDLVWTVEHEAAHIAFHLPSDNGLQEDRANVYVRECRAEVVADDRSRGGKPIS